MFSIFIPIYRNMKNFSKNIILWIVIGMLLIALFNLFQGSSNNKYTTTVSFSDFMAAMEAGNVSEVNIRGNNVEGYLNDGRPFKTYAPNYPNLVDKLNDSGVRITAMPNERKWPIPYRPSIEKANSNIRGSIKKSLL